MRTTHPVADTSSRPSARNSGHTRPCRSANLVLDRCAKRAGLDGEGRYSAHNLRAGLVTTLAERGRTEVEIMRQSRHRSSAMVRAYTRPVDAKLGCPLAGAF